MAHRRLLLILGLALLVRVGFGLTQREPEASTDELHWHRIAIAFLQDGLLAEQVGTYRPPLYPLLLSATYRVCGPRLAVVRLWQAVMGTVTCALLFAVGRRLGGERAGLLAAALTAGYPFFIFFTGILMAETLLVFLTAMALLLALRFEENPSTLRAFGLGTVLGLGVLCKPVLLIWAPVLLWGWRRRTRLGGWAQWGRAAGAIGGLALVIAPWTARNYAMTGRLALVSTNLGMNLLVGHEAGAIGRYREGMNYLEMYRELVDSEPNAALADRLAVRRIGGQMLSQPWRTAQLAVRKLVWFWSPLPTGVQGWRRIVGLLSSGPLLTVGLWGVWQVRKSPAGWIVGSLSLSLSLIHAAIFAHTRFRLPLDAALVGPAALVITQSWERWEGRRR